MPQGKLVRMSNGSYPQIVTRDLGFIKTIEIFRDASGREIFAKGKPLPVKYVKNINDAPDDPADPTDPDEGNLEELPDSGDVDFQVDYYKRPRILYWAKNVTLKQNSSGIPKIAGKLKAFDCDFYGKAVGFIKTNSPVTDVNGDVILKADRLVAFERSKFPPDTVEVGTKLYFLLDFDRKTFFVTKVLPIVV